jgi:hypothetical protein
LLPSDLPREIPVPSAIFTTLHEAEALCTSLETDCLHPAFEAYGHVSRKITETIRSFRLGRANLLLDSADCERTVASLKEAERQVEGFIKRYRFIEEMMGSEKGPKIKKKVSLGKRGFERKEYGEFEVAPVDGGVAVEQPIPNPTPVTLRDGLPAFQIIIQLEGTQLKKSGTLGNNFRWLMKQEERRARISPKSFNLDRSRSSVVSSSDNKVHYEDKHFFVVGLVISCETGVECEKSFYVTEGGIMKGALEIKVTCAESSGAQWRCRIILVRQGDYNFPKLR